MEYSKSDCKIEHRLLFISMAISFGMCFLAQKFLSNYIDNELTEILLFFIFGPFLGIYVFFRSFSKYFFKIPFLHKVCSIPNFNGIWKGEGTSLFGNGLKFNVEIKIKQSLTHISINAYFNKSQSETFACCVRKENDKQKLIYNYLNIPEVAAKSDKHYGTVTLEKQRDDELIGAYFTDREPQTKGNLELKKSNQ